MTRIPGYPQKQGLYDPARESDACGIGFVVNIKGHKSHKLVRQSLEVLEHLKHRGACGCEANTGDGAGMLVQLPHKFFSDVCDFALPAPGEYGVGMLFLPPDPGQRQVCEEHFVRIVEEEGPAPARLAGRAHPQRRLGPHRQAARAVSASGIYRSRRGARRRRAGF